MSFINRPCTITPRSVGTADAYNDEVLTDGTPVSTVCEIQPVSRAENLVATTSTGTHRGWFLVDAVIDTHSTVTLNGVVYEMDGPPSKRWDPDAQEFVFWQADLRVVA